jgi:hypothetical protein
VALKPWRVEGTSDGIQPEMANAIANMLLIDFFPKLE